MITIALGILLAVVLLPLLPLAVGAAFIVAIAAVVIGAGGFVIWSCFHYPLLGILVVAAVACIGVWSGIENWKKS